MVTFCPACGGPDFCLPDCRVTRPKAQYLKRTVWCAKVMLSLASNDEQRKYYGEQLARATAALQDADRFIVKFPLRQRKVHRGNN